MVLGRAEAILSRRSAQWAGVALPAKKPRWEVGVGREEHVGGSGKHTSGKVGINFLVFKSRD